LNFELYCAIISSFKYAACQQSLQAHTFMKLLRQLKNIDFLVQMLLITGHILP